MDEQCEAPIATPESELNVLRAEVLRLRNQNYQRDAVERVPRGEFPPTYGGALVGQDTPIPPQDVVIGKVSNGFIVKVGCQTYVSQKWEEVAEGLGLFFSKPEEAIKKYYKK